VVAPGGRLFAVLRVAIVDGRISEVDIVADPSRLERVALTVPGP
jgi:hypothetical protein